MDNAAKALIMAGAILVSIAIVGVGVYIFSSTGSMTDVGVNQLESSNAQTTNSTIRQYVGNRVKGTTVIEFIEFVGTLNANKTFPKNLVVKVTGVNGVGSLASGDTDYASTSAIRATLISNISENSFYTVSALDVQPSTEDGYYDLITISEN